MSWHKWDKSSIVSKLKEYHRAGIDLNIQKKVWEHDPLLEGAIERHFDSYAQAMAAAGLEYVSYRQRWNKEKIIAELKRYQSEGVRLAPSELKRRDCGLHWLTVTYFGSYRKALKAAGIDYRQFLLVREWTRPRIIAALRRFHRQGVSLHQHAMVRQDNGLLQATYNHFGSYAAAIEAAGLDYESIRRHRSWTRDQVIERLKEIHQQGGDLSPSYLLAHKNIALYYAAMAHCGSYRKALKAAGIDYRVIYRPKNYTWPVERVLNLIKEYHEQGKDLSQQAVRRGKDRGLVSAGERHFGSWRAALEAVGIDYCQVAKLRRWTRDEIIADLQALQQAGEYMSCQAVRIKHSKLVAAASRYFHGWANALKAADIPPIVHPNRINNRRHWTESMILQRIREMEKAGTDLRDRPMMTHYQSLYYAAKKSFGTYVNAVQQAGIDYDQIVQRALGNKPAGTPAHL